jgi:3-hydroxyisobutyrate dehydrogenase-like beta-hydroxyacid dehydrogenase
VRVGFIGIGRMGSAIAGRVLEGGHELTVWNRTPEKTTELAGRGAQVASSVAEACARAEAVLTMLANDDALLEVALGSGGIVESLEDGAIHVVMGTHGIAAVRTLTERHAEAGQVLVAAPVLGRPDVAAAGQLGIVAAGPADAVDRCRPLFEAIGRRTFEAGDRPESATSIKLANNFVLGAAIETMAEAFTLVRTYAVDPALFNEVLTEGLFAAPAYKVYGTIIAEEDYDRVGFTTELALKDVDLALAAAGHAHVPLPSANVLRDRLLSAIAHGDSDRDWAVLAREQARMSGLDEHDSASFPLPPA